MNSLTQGCALTVEAISNEYECDSCGWVYRAGQHGDLDIDAQPQGWQCPSCQADRDHFVLVVPSDEDLGDDGDEEDFEPTADISAGGVIRTKRAEPDVETLRSRWLKKKLETQPDFQRYEVWSNQKRSRLVESVLLGLPIPLFYFAEEPDGREVVIDGQQRLTALFRFTGNEYGLTGLGPLRAFEGKTFADLDEKYQDVINSFTLSIVTVLKDSDPDVRFTMFERLNEGATKLNDQELRNSVYRGDYNEELKKLSTLPDFWKLIRQKAKHKRMVDVELVLRFMAFRNQTYLKHPDKKTKEFLNREMELGKHRSVKERMQAAKDFKQAVASSLTVFGDRAFRRFAAGDPDSGVDGKWESRFNRALFDVQMYGFTQHSRGLITKNADAINEASIDLMSDATFADLVTHTISEKKRVIKRFRMWLDMLDGVIGDDQQGARTFSRKTKERLFTEDPTCSLCHQEIKSIDDAHVDHVAPFSGGGRTDDHNAALAHRICNILKASS